MWEGNLQAVAKQCRASNEDHLDFLPCIIPNSCSWSYCGGGQCNQVSTFTHTCACERVYKNLCFTECAVGMDCKKLGIGGLNDSNSISPPSSSDNGNNQAASEAWTIADRLSNCYQVVESMRLGMEPKAAAEDAIRRIARKYPDFVGAVFAVNKGGEHAGACHGWTFQYSVRSLDMEDVKVFTVLPRVLTA